MFIFFVVVVSQEAESCITYLDDCDGCQPIFDDNLTTFMTLQSGDGIYQESHRLLINQTCVKITEVRKADPTHVIQFRRHNYLKRIAYILSLTVICLDSLFSWLKRSRTVQNN